MSGIDLRLPVIHGGDREQLAQIRSYLYQLIPQLQIALSKVSGSGLSENDVKQIVKTVGATESATGSSTVGANVSFEKIKPLIIASAEIVEAYYPKVIEKLNGQFFAKSNFGTFIENTNRIKEASAKYTDEQFEVTQTLISNNDYSIEALGSNAVRLGESLEELEAALKTAEEKISSTTGEVNGLKGGSEEAQKELSSLRDSIEAAKASLGELSAVVAQTNGHIKVGIIDYDSSEMPVIGIEVGQENIVNGEKIFSKYARFTSGRLSFFDRNGTEVAYISDYKLYITDAEITGTLKLGGFITKTTGGLVIKWAGRG